jgi:thioredoxin-related protein
MQRIFLSLLFACFILSTNAQNAETAGNILKAATKRAAKENKNVLVIFHASWCVWCRKMDASINDLSVKKYFDRNYVITHLVVQESIDKKYLENSGAEKFLEDMGGKDEGLPYWVILDKNGNKLADSEMQPGENTGCPASEKEVAHFKNVLKNTSALTDEEIKVIGKRFSKNQ